MPVPLPPEAPGVSAVAPATAALATLKALPKLVVETGVVSAGGNRSGSGSGSGGSSHHARAVSSGHAPISTANKTGVHSHPHEGHANKTGVHSHPHEGHAQPARSAVGRQLLSGIRLAAAHSAAAKAGHHRRREDANAAVPTTPHRRSRSERHHARRKDGRPRGR